jgi:hypothetical protein
MIKNYIGLLPTFKHQDSHVLGINNGTFLNFSEYCDFDLEKMDDEICMGLAKHNCTIFPAVSGQLPKNLHTGDFENKFYENEFILSYADNSTLEKIKNLSTDQRRKYLFYKNKIIQPWNFIFVLKPNKFQNKTKNVLPWENFVDLDFTYTKKCIEKLPLKEIGRVVIYASWPNNPVPPHRDGPIESHKDHHININPGGYRPVYVYDSINDTKYYLDRNIKMYAFNVRDYHGVDAQSKFSYTLRIDGEYNQDILNKFDLKSGII